MTHKIIYIATGNTHKLRELDEMLKDSGVVIHGISALPDFIQPEETGTTFSENSHIKARALFDHLKKKNLSFDFVLADDSGLLCDDLQGAPGILSARYAGPDATTAENNAKLIADFQNCMHVTRGARFACALTLIANDGTENQFEGICEGLITLDSKGSNGFGYDPLFYLPTFAKTMAELPAAIKNRISHRAKALQKLNEWWASQSRIVS